MKKFLISFLSILILTVLVACGQAKDSLDGEYYYITDSGETYLELVIDGQGGRYFGDGELPITEIDKKNKTFSFVYEGRDYIGIYKIKEDGELELVVDGFLDAIVYKKGSPAYNEKVK